MIRIIQDLVHIVTDAVGNDDLLGQTPQDLTHSNDRRGIVEGFGTQELRQQVGGALDGASHQLREKGDEHAEGHHVARGLDVATININGVADSLECIE